MKSDIYERLANILERVAKISPEQRKLLELLIKQDKQQPIVTNLKNWFYEVEWQPKPRQALDAGSVGENPKLMEPGTWLILADQGGLGEALAKHLQELGHKSILVYAAEAYKTSETGTWGIDPANSTEFERLFQEALEANALPLKGVIHLWSLEAACSDELTISALEQAQILGCGSVLHLVQTLVKRHQSVSPRLWLITRGAAPVGHHPVAVAQAPLWGLGKVITLEHPELWGGMLDLAPEATEAEAAALLAEIWDSLGEDHLAFRSGQRYVARLVHSHPQSPQALQFWADGTYLITGGLGALGLKVATWMVEQGARHLVLTGRSGASAQAQEILSQLEQAGAKVLVAKADVSNAGDMHGVLEAVKASMPPLHGIIHAAGVLDDGILLQQNWERFSRVMAPKVKGAWNLHILTQGLPLDFFVLFSSAASLLGSPGQGNYAAANTFMDLLAHYRRALGKPGLSINWGPWASAGMAAELGSRNKRRIAELGLEPIAPEQGLQVLAELLGQDAVQVGVVPVKWPTFIQQFPLGAYPAFISELAHQVGQQVKGEQPQALQLEILRQLEESSPGDRHSLLIAYIQEQVAKTLGLCASQLEVQQPLNNMGLDSLMTVELSNRIKSELGVDVPMMKLMQGLSIAQLAELLLEQLALARIILSDPTSPEFSDDMEEITL